MNPFIFLPPPTQDFKAKLFFLSRCLHYLGESNSKNTPFEDIGT